MSQDAERTRMVVQEAEWASFGDARLKYRAQRIAKAVAAQPALSFPQALATEMNPSLWKETNKAPGAGWALEGNS